MKKLNDVLNGVMNDILSEGWFGSEPTMMDKFKAQQELHRQQMADGYGPADLPGGSTSGIYNYRYGQPGNPNGVPAGEDPTSDADLGFTDRMAAMWNGLSDAQKMAALGGLGGTALAAGAGALYLRRKQRDANRSSGR